MRKPIPQEEEPLTWKERIAALTNLPRFFRLVWETSPKIMIADFVLRIARSATPVAILYTGKLIIDQVVHLAKGNASPNATHHLWELVALEFGLAILSDGLSRAIYLMDSLLGDRFSNYT